MEYHQKQIQNLQVIKSENQIENAATEDVSQTDVDVDLEVMERQIETLTLQQRARLRKWNLFGKINEIQNSENELKDVDLEWEPENTSSTATEDSQADVIVDA